MKKYKYAFLVNPLAGSGCVGKIVSQLPVFLDRIHSAKGQYCIELTRFGQVQKQAQYLSRSATSIVVIGGDGTVSDAIAGISYGEPATTLGIVPMGTANDLARTLNINQLFNRKPFHKALEHLLSAPNRPLDVWQINSKRIMSNYLSLGFDAAVNAYFCRERHKSNISQRSLLRTKIAFCKHGLYRFFHHVRPGSYMRFWHEGRERKILLELLCSVIFSNIKYYASGIGPAPFADDTDGFLDITLFPTLPHYMGLFITQKLRLMHKYYNRNLKQYYSNQIDIYSSPGNYLQIDGEDCTELLLEGKITIKKFGQVRVLTISESD